MSLYNLSEMPKVILARIVYFLPLRDAVATSTLSLQWQFMWKSSITNLDFDGEETVMALSTKDYYNDELDSERSRFVTSMDSVLAQLEGADHIDQLRVYFDFERSFTSTIDGWVQFPMKKKVQVLEFELRSWCPTES